MARRTMARRARGFLVLSYFVDRHRLSEKGKSFRREWRKIVVKICGGLFDFFGRTKKWGLLRCFTVKRVWVLPVFKKVRHSILYAGSRARSGKVTHLVFAVEL